MTLTLKSEAFADGEVIPRRFTCDGEDVSPPLAWTDPPAGTRSFALIMDDPDAPRGVWVHWVLFNLRPHLAQIGEGGSRRLPEGAIHGTNSWGRTSYGGPCPPGGTHRYYFKLYALGDALDSGPEVTAQDLEQTMAAHVLAEATLMGRYSRSQPPPE